MNSEKWLDSHIDWWWRTFSNSWVDVGSAAFADLSTGGDSSVEECLEKMLSPPEDPSIPSELVQNALKHIFGRTDLGDYRNKIKNVYGHPVGVTVHVKRDFGQNILTVEDFGGECPLINIVTTSGKKITLNIGKIPVGVDGSIETKRLEF